MSISRTKGRAEQTQIWEVVGMRLAVGNGGLAQAVRDCRSQEIKEINESERRV